MNSPIFFFFKRKFDWFYLELLLAITYISVVFYKQYRMFYALHFIDFDLSIFHQGIWLICRFERPFVTIRGLHFFGDHTNFIDLIFVPIYWIYAHPLILLFVETVILGLSGLLLYIIAKKQLKDEKLAFFVSLLFFTYPALHYLNFENYHPDVFVVFAIFHLALWNISRSFFKQTLNKSK